MLRILVVDDERQTCQMIKRGLESTKRFIVDQAFSGETALELLPTGHYDLVILDLIMPGVDGLEVLRQRHLYPATRVIVLTADISLSSAILALRQKVDDYLMKPVSMETLLQSVDEHIGVLRFAGIEVYDNGGVMIDGKEAYVPERLLQLLVFFMRAMKQPYNYEEIILYVDHEERDRDAARDALSTQMSRLRRLLRKASGVELLDSHKNGGFEWTRAAWEREFRYIEQHRPPNMSI